MVCTVINHRNDKYKFKIATTSRRRVLSLKRFEHFEVISKVDNSKDHGKLLSIFFTISLTVSKLKFLGKTCTKETDKQIAPPSHHFMVCTHIDHIALDQSANDKSLSYGKTFVRTKKITCCDCQATYIGETGRNLSTQLTVHKRAITLQNTSYRRKTKFTGTV